MKSNKVILILLMIICISFIFKDIKNKNFTIKKEIHHNYVNLKKRNNNLFVNNCKKKHKNLEKKIIIKTNFIKVILNTIGGDIEKVELLKYKDNYNKNENFSLFNNDKKKLYIFQSGLMSKKYPNHNSLYKENIIFKNKNEIKVILKSQKNKLELIKTYTFKKSTYLININYTVINHNKFKNINSNLYLRILHDGNKSSYNSYFYKTFTGFSIYNQKDKYKKIYFKNISNKIKKIVLSNNGWFGVVQRYFVSAFIIPFNTINKLFIIKIDNLFSIYNVINTNKLLPNKYKKINIKLYTGPQLYNVLQKTAIGLESVKDYGLLTVIVKPIFKLMINIHLIVKNWGWTIILLTIIMKIMFLPISFVAYKNALKIKKITPQILKIKKIYKKDFSTINKKIFYLYQKEKIDLLSGFLPIVIQIPVFLSLYCVLSSSVEIRNSYWIFWIKDLSLPDKFYVLPMIMTILMIIQVIINRIDNNFFKKKIFIFVPIIFSITFFFLPSGIVIYWIINNIFSIIQQLIILKKK